MHIEISTILVWIFVCVDVTYQEIEFEEQSLVTYTSCKLDSDCLRQSNNSFCFDNDQEKLGYCKCKEGYELVSRNKTFFACLGSVGYGEQCEKNVQCQLTLNENAECSKGTCQCKENSHLFTDGKCHVSVVLGEYCRNEANCWLSNGTFGNCVSGRCTCKYDNQVPNADLRSCVVGRSLAESCDDDVQCALVPNAVCRVKCECAAGYALSRDRKRCLRAATMFGDPCEEEDQCSSFLQGGLCRANTCACAEGQHGFSNRCVKTALLGETCASSEDCIPSAAYLNVIGCEGGSCQCLPGVVNATVGCNGSVRDGGSFIFGLIFSFLSIAICNIAY